MKFRQTEYTYCAINREIELNDHLVEAMNHEIEINLPKGATFTPVTLEDIVAFINGEGDRREEILHGEMYDYFLGNFVMDTLNEWAGEADVAEVEYDDDSYDWTYDLIED